MFSTWRRRILITVVIVLVGLSIPVVLELHARSKARADLEKIIAELDAADPRWRLEDIEADRQQVPAEKNSANTVVAAFGLLPKNWHPEIHDELEKIPPPIALRIEQADKLAAELKPLEAALQTARKLKNLPLGRYKLGYSLDWWTTSLSGQNNSHEVAQLLDLDASQFLHRKEMEKAWNSNRALLNSGRSLGDEPLVVSMLLRMAIGDMAVRSLERCLAHGVIQSSYLEESQKHLEEELTVPFFFIGLRGERAGIDYLLTNIENGKINLIPTLEIVSSTQKIERVDENLLDPIQEFFWFSIVLRSHGILLKLQTRQIEAAKLPAYKRYEVITEIGKSYKALVTPKDWIIRSLFPAVVKFAESEQRRHTLLACAIAGLGAERFRLMKNRWPDSLEETVQAGCLKKVPTDLFDGKPLRFRRSKDGLVIYSIGPDGKYDGKALDDLRNIDESVIRVEFRLWDLPHRRQAPLPPKAKE